MPSLTDTVRLEGPRSQPRTTGAELEQWITADEVARLLKVSRSWVYEHTRVRPRSTDVRLPFIKIGKYVRFNPRAIAELLEKRQPRG